VPLGERAANIPAAVAEVIERALDNAPEKRYRDAGEMRQALEAAVRRASGKAN
jgi:hypothetical protein